MTLTDAPLTEEFTGSPWSNYTTSNGRTNGVVLGQGAGYAPYTWGLNTLQHLDVRTFNGLPNSFPVQHRENWTTTGGSLTLGADSTFNHWSRLTAVLPVGLTTIASVSDPVSLIHISDQAQLTLALPNFPLSSINLATSYLDLSSDGFASTIASLPFSASSTTLIAGDSSASWPLVSILNIDLTNVTSVRLRIDVNTACTIYFAALRLIGPNWVQSNIDFDTWNGGLRQCIPLTGSLTSTVPSNQVMPSVWYASPAGSSSDPRPINSTFGVMFNTGNNSALNSFTMNMRAVKGVDTSQLALQGTPQIQINTNQPNLVPSVGIPRTMSDLASLNMASAQTQSMTNLGNTLESFNSTWISFTIAWGLSPSITVANLLNPRGYTWPSTLLPTWAARTWYLAVFSLKETNARVQVFAVDQSNLSTNMQGVNPQILFDTGQIADSYQLPRRAGRIGWQTNLGDGDAQIRSIRPMGLTFAAYQSVALQSNTPVKGARLYVYTTPSTKLFQNWLPTSLSSSVATNNPPGLVSSPVIEGTILQPGSILNTTNGAWSNNPTAYTYQWKHGDGTNIAGATQSAYTIQTGDVGQIIQVTVTAINAAGSTTASSSLTNPITTVPTNITLPIISGTAQVGQTLTATNGTWANNPSGFLYQWQYGNGTNISGATNSSYPIQAADAGQTLRVQVIATNSDGPSLPTNSNPTSSVTINPAPVNTSLPVITGTVAVGNTLTASTGSWTNSPTSYAWQWSRDGVSISGATSSTYTIQSADAGHQLTSSITATNLGGSTVATTAQTITVPVPSPPVNITTPIISASDGNQTYIAAGDTATTTNGTWSNNPTSYTYQWYTIGFFSGPISGATLRTLNTTGLGLDTIYAIVTVSNGAGSTSATSNQLQVYNPRY